jgi:hypothetical protein
MQLCLSGGDCQAEGNVRGCLGLLESSNQCPWHHMLHLFLLYRTLYHVHKKELMLQATTSILNGISMTEMRWAPSVVPGTGTYCCRKAQHSASREAASVSVHSVSWPQVCSSSHGQSTLRNWKPLPQVAIHVFQEPVCQHRS